MKGALRILFQKYPCDEGVRSRTVECEMHGKISLVISYLRWVFDMSYSNMRWVIDMLYSYMRWDIDVS